MSSAYVCVFASASEYEWSSFIELSVSIYDPLPFNKCHTFPPAPRINSEGSEKEKEKEKGKGV